MKKKFEIQTIIVLLCALGIAGAWIGVQITKDSLGVWSESAELHFTTSDLLGLQPRSELHCAGAVIGHVRKVTPGPVGGFTLVAGVRNDFAGWTFAPVGIVKLGVVQAAFAPSAIDLELSNMTDKVQARPAKQGLPPSIPLKGEEAKKDLAAVAAQYGRLGDQIDQTIRQFTEAQDDRSESVMKELANAIPSVAASMRQLEEVTASLSGRSRLTETDPAKLPIGMDRLLLKLDATTDHLEGIAASIETKVGDNGKIDDTLTKLNENLETLQRLTEQTTKTIRNVNLQFDGSMRRVNGLLDETTGTMSALHDKIDRLGGTFVGRMLIAKPPQPDPSPPSKRPTKIR